MAGGEGSRLRPLTSARPKPLAPVANKPVMHHIVDLLRRHGIVEIVATLHYMADEIETYFGNGSDFGVTMHYVVEDSPLGTAGAVKHAERFIGSDPFFVLNGDSYVAADLVAMRGAHGERGAAITMVVTDVPDTARFGSVVHDAGRVTGFAEKGRSGAGSINAGIYLLSRPVVESMEANKAISMEHDVLPAYAGRGRLFAFEAPGPFIDIGTPESFVLAPQVLRKEPLCHGS